MRSIKSHIRKTKFNCLLIVCFALPFSSAVAEVFDLGGMYTYHYHDGRYADWGDYARHGARIAIEEVNASGMLGDDQLRLKPENTIDYHCWPEGAATMAETLMKKGVLAITGADCSGPAVEIANMAAQYNIPVISNGANDSVHEKSSETTPSGTASRSERNSVSRAIPITKLLKRMWPRFGMRAFDTSS
jgi:ABC-type branched-subunit amino acid transport system substrate-binding protein